MGKLQLFISIFNSEWRRINNVDLQPTVYKSTDKDCAFLFLPAKKPWDCLLWLLPPARALAARTRLPMACQWQALTAFIHHETSSGSVSLGQQCQQQNASSARLVFYLFMGLASPLTPPSFCYWGKCRPSNQSNLWAGLRVDLGPLENAVALWKKKKREKVET